MSNDAPSAEIKEFVLCQTYDTFCYKERGSKKKKKTPTVLIDTTAFTTEKEV